MRLSHLTDSQMRYGGPEHLLGKLALVTFEAKVKGMPIERVIAQRFSDVEGVTIKAAQNPASSDTPGYAQELAGVSYAQFLDLVQGSAILPSAVPPAQLYEFANGAGTINVPTRSAATLGGGFRGERQPIVVRGTPFSSALLKPKSLAVIVSATGELLRSPGNPERVFEALIRKDTSLELDKHFVSADARSAIAPGGVRADLDAGDTRASSGATAAQISDDLKLMLSALATAGFGSDATRWVMSPANFYALAMLFNATGALQFPEAQRGRLADIPIVRSAAMPDDVILLIDFAAFAFGISAPAFETTEMAELHEEDTTPLPIATPGAPNVVAAPVRSMFQTYSTALRLVAESDWLKLAPVGPVQELSAVAWA